MISGRYAPIYTDGDSRFKADACLPLVSAAERGEVQLRALARGHYPGQRLERRHLPGLKTVGYWDAPQKQSWSLDWHRNEGVEISYCETGSLAFEVDAFHGALNDGDLAVTRPWQLHRVGSPYVGAGRLHWLILDVGVRRPNQRWRWPRWVILDPADRQELTELLRHNERAVWPAVDLRGHFHAIAKTVADGGAPGAISRLAVAINQLLLSLIEVFRESREGADRTLSESQHVVQLFLQDLAVNQAAFAREWNVDAMASSCGLGRTQFLRYCRHLTNMSPANYLQQCRLEAAAKRLRGTSATVASIAMECGFSSGQYFATTFQQRYGCSPGSYRRDGCPAAERSPCRRPLPEPR